MLARHALRAGDSIEGPAIVEQLDTTTVLEPGDTGSVDAAGNLIIVVDIEPEETPLLNKPLSELDAESRHRSDHARSHP